MPRNRDGSIKKTSRIPLDDTQRQYVEEINRAIRARQEELGRWLTTEEKDAMAEEIRSRAS